MKLEADRRYVFQYQALEKLVEEVYGLKIDILNDEDFIPWERKGHYTYHEWTVDGESELNTVGDDEIVAKWIETGEIKALDMSDVPEYDWRDTAEVRLEHILHRLFIEDIIPSGKYVMLVDW